MARSLIHPRMLERLGDFYPSQCTIFFYNNENRDDHGQPDPFWEVLPGYTEIPCAIAPSGGHEVKLPDLTYTVSSHHVSLKGYYPGITEKMKAAVDGAVYHILLVENDSQKCTTRLTAEVIR